MAPSLRQSCFMANISLAAFTYSVAFGAAVLAGSVLVCTIRCGAQATTNVSDSVNGAWARLGSFVSNGSNSGGMWWVISAAGTPTVTVANTASVDFNVQGYFGEYTGIKSLRDSGQFGVAGTSTTTGTTPNAAATVVAGDLIVVGVWNSTNNADTYSAGALSGVTGTLAIGSFGANQSACNEWAIATSSGSDVTGVFCTSGSEREFTLEGSWYAD
jgi:hypothetical protein